MKKEVRSVFSRPVPASSCGLFLIALIHHDLASPERYYFDAGTLSGSSGKMYAITLCSHGYTFVGKGSRSDEVPTLVHELSI